MMRKIQTFAEIMFIEFPLIFDIRRSVVIAMFFVGLTYSCSYAQYATAPETATNEQQSVDTPTDEQTVNDPPVTEQMAVTETEPTGSDPVAMIETSTPEAAVEPSSTIQEGHVTLDFKEADIRNVLRILAYKSGVNIVPGPEVAGLVSIQLTDVPWEKALAVILETYGYGYDRKENIILVTTIENLKKRREDAKILSDQEPLITKTFILNYAKASKVIGSIEKMKTARGTIDFDDRTNTLIIRDIPSNVELIAQIIPSLDQPTPQVLIESKVVETTLSNTENLGVDWVAKATAQGMKMPTVWPFTTQSENKYLPDAIPTAPAANFTYGTLDSSQFQAILEILKTRTDTNILSSPRIVTVDNQKASISVGSQYPIPSYTYNEEQARLQVSGWEYMDIGVLFDVTPHVNNAGFVTMDIQPRITDILDFVTVENTSLPRLSNEAAKTSVMVKDGQTLVIAGLIKDKITDTKKKVPFLGDIPILGIAFKKTSKTISKTDLLIFIKPTILTPDASTGNTNVAVNSASGS